MGTLPIHNCIRNNEIFGGHATLVFYFLLQSPLGWVCIQGPTENLKLSKNERGSHIQRQLCHTMSHQKTLSCIHCSDLSTRKNAKRNGWQVSVIVTSTWVPVTGWGTLLAAVTCEVPCMWQATSLCTLCLACFLSLLNMAAKLKSWRARLKMQTLMSHLSFTFPVAFLWCLWC